MLSKEKIQDIIMEVSNAVLAIGRGAEYSGDMAEYVRDTAEQAAEDIVAMGADAAETKTCDHCGVDFSEADIAAHLAALDCGCGGKVRSSDDPFHDGCKYALWPGELTDEQYDERRADCKHLDTISRLDDEVCRDCGAVNDLKD